MGQTLTASTAAELLLAHAEDLENPELPDKVVRLFCALALRNLAKTLDQNPRGLGLQSSAPPMRG